jgi:hypothetical protein
VGDGRLTVRLVRRDADHRDGAGHDRDADERPNDRQPTPGPTLLRGFIAHRRLLSTRVPRSGIPNI